MKRYNITLAGKTYSVEVLDDPTQNEIRVDVDGEVFTVGVETVAEAGGAAVPLRLASVAAPAPTAPEGNAGSNVVKSPLPGVIKSIAVKPGQTVAFNDELCVIEAMKAMNVIRAPRAGTIGTIYVTVGCKVSYGAPLMDLG
jgi:oxaloacetate decarboxylase alpha subunit